jgi:hypothetical protein
VAPSRNQMALTGATGFVTDNNCNDTASNFTLTAAAGTATTTVTVTPSTTLCSTRAAGGATTTTTPGQGGSGGGGGGGSYGVSTSQTSTSNSSAQAPAGTTGSVAALQAQLNALLAQIALLTGKANPSANAYANANANASFNRNLTLGATGADVKALQAYLNAHGFVVAASGAGSPGNETTKFGKATMSALAKWQASVGISPASGNFGAKTRAYIAAHQ